MERNHLQSDGPLASRFRKVLRIVGVRDEQRFTTHSIASFLVGVVNFCYLGYVMVFTECNITKVAHFMVLQYFYIGTLWTVVSKSGRVLEIARDCDRLVGLDDERIEGIYAFHTEARKDAPQVKGMGTVSVIACIICSYTCVEPFLKAYAGNKELEFPFTGTTDDTKLFVAVYVLQCLLMFITACVCVAIFQTQMGTALNLVVKYKVLNSELSNLNLRMVDSSDVYASTLYQTVRKCVQTHHHVLSIFEKYKEVCSYGFQFSYIGLLGATTLSRALLSGDEPDLGTIPHIIAELSYIGFFCYILDELEEEHTKLKDAVYSAEWAHMPKPVVKLLRLIMMRTEKIPHVILYKGGGYANLDTFYRLLNGTCAYLIFGMVLDQAF
ncbi:Odorant receptor [Nesidiocoris tenuis]|uniref:Odorant receptor n=1 Tax=Nesidiocoris tenuis TaxID=355587 RepID=A0ABN7A5T4_9HEMI|nr:Odorant receptor [Nesidiocoris tenuis]